MIGPGIFTMGVACSLLLLGCYSYYRYRQTVIEQAAKEAFMEAVNDEAYKRTSNMELIISIDGGQLLKRDETPDLFIVMMSLVIENVRFIQGNIGGM